MKRKTWDINEFNKINLPTYIGSLSTDLQKEFSDYKGIRVLDLPVHMPNQGIRVPATLPQIFSKIIHCIIAHEQQRYGDAYDHYVYVTIDQKYVEAGKTGRRAGAHSDAYIERDNRQIDITESCGDVIENEVGEVSHTYVVYDRTPTEFFRAKFPLKKVDCESSLKTFDEIAEQAEVVTYPSYHILKMDPYVVHRSAVAKESGYRTFMKVSVSRKRYAREGNTRNPLFHYDQKWKFKGRDEDNRNHPW